MTHKQAAATHPPTHPPARVVGQVHEIQDGQGAVARALAHVQVAVLICRRSTQGAGVRGSRQVRRPRCARQRKRMRARAAEGPSRRAIPRSHPGPHPPPASPCAGQPVLGAYCSGVSAMPSPSRRHVWRSSGKGWGSPKKCPTWGEGGMARQGPRACGAKASARRAAARRGLAFLACSSRPHTLCACMACAHACMPRASAPVPGRAPSIPGGVPSPACAPDAPSWRATATGSCDAAE